MGVLVEKNRGRGGAILTPNELVLTFRGSYVYANFGENWSRNATVRVLADGQTHTQTQTDFIICPMLYAIAMGQIIITVVLSQITKPTLNPRFFPWVCPSTKPRFKWRCVTQQPLATVIVLSVAVIIGKGGTGNGTIGKGSAHRAWCTYHARCVINPIDAKAQFPALSPCTVRWRTATL